MKKIALIFGLFLCVVSFSQTKLISHKSHSGSNENFRIALEKNLFDIENSNLGAAPDRYERNASLDTVVYISKGKAIMITSEHCVRADRDNYKIINSKIWHAGKDTVYNHVLFSKNHSLDSIKNVLKDEYNFRNDIEKVVFIGFDNNKKVIHKSNKKKKSTIPIIDFKNNFPSKPFLILCLIVLASIVAFFSWKTTIQKNVVS